MRLRSTAYQKLYDYLTLHSKDYFNSRFAGSLTNKISNAVEGTDELFEKMLWRFIPLFLGLVFYAIIVATSNIFLGLITIVWSIIFLAANFFFAFKLQPLSYRSAESLSTLKGRVVDSISNISLVHENAYILGEREYIKKFIKKQYDAGLKSWWFSEWVLVANGIIVFIFIFTIITFSIMLFQNHLISIGSVVMIATIASDLTYQLFFIAQEIRDSSRLYGQIREGLDEILTEHIIIDTPNARSLKVTKGEISIEKINFEYDKVTVFKNFSIKIPAGQKVGFVGKSGTGKTTLVSLLLRHFDVSDGEIKIDGQNIREVTLESLRRAIAFVPQDTTLFHRTIRENISYSNPEATIFQIEKAAKSAQAHEFIMRLPQGYETLVGERGIKLSGGQRQRIAIARAFLKDAPILILDEATSSLDSESEQAIQTSLTKLMKKGTVIAIAHRLSTLKEMDKIVIIDNGKIVEEGSPKELLDKQSGIFKKMWERQVQGFIVDE
ncbi:MAG: hypothetical protein A2152_03480 [Candidatus Levybacteria bacterium RBG_16_35_6]|nr:MAG: hypothetical protein A2152_03480 [Candidatus Levybacteria bacterium RBG_16_35_6]